jgi:hypothetical protein
MRRIGDHGYWRLVYSLSSDRPSNHLNGRPASCSLRAVIDENLWEEERSQINAKIALMTLCRNNDETFVALEESIRGVPHFLSALMKDPLKDW